MFAAPHCLFNYFLTCKPGTSRHSCSLYRSEYLYDLDPHRRLERLVSFLPLKSMVYAVFLCSFKSTALFMTKSRSYKT